MDVDLGILRRLVRRADARELLDLTRARFLVQTLGIALLGLLHGDVDEDLNEGQRRVGVLGVGVELARELAVGFVGGNEGGQGDGRRIGEELGDLYISIRDLFGTSLMLACFRSYLRNTPDVLLPVLG